MISTRLPAYRPEVSVIPARERRDWVAAGELHAWISMLGWQVSNTDARFEVRSGDQAV